MKQRLLRLAVAILTFVVGWSISLIVLKPASESIVLPPLAMPSAVPTAWPVLLSWQNRDLKHLDGPEKAQLEMAISVLRATENQFLEPRLFSRVSNSLGEHRYVLVEEQPLVFIPGDSRLQISLFDLDGKLLDSSEFPAGWRIMLSGIKFVHVKDIGGDVLEVESGASINGADVGRQYYALVGDKMRLIRLEDSKRALRPNTYRSPNHTIGFTEVGRSAADWEKALITKDKSEILATLTWLGGWHLNVDEAIPDYWHEDLSEARLAKEVRARPAVKAAVKAMKGSPDAWIREAAKLASDETH